MSLHHKLAIKLKIFFLQSLQKRFEALSETQQLLIVFLKLFNEFEVDDSEEISDHEVLIERPLMAKIKINKYYRK